MRKNTKKILAPALAFFALLTAVFATKYPASDAAVVSVSQVYVSICGNGILEGESEGVEQCDDGKHCADATSCTDDADCVGIGDNLCKTRNGDGCSATCQIETSGGGGGYEPPVQNVFISKVTAQPELRSGAVGTNYDVSFFFKILNPDNSNHSVLYSHSTLLNTDNTGVNYTPVEVAVIQEGTYDVSLKTKSHLTTILDNVHLYPGENFLNFTNAANLPTIGSIKLTAGDIDGVGVDPGNLGDDVINAVDLSVLLQKWGTSDPTGNSVRANLNQDNTVDQSDLNILLGNLDKTGDK